MSGKSKRTVSLERGTVDISREDKRKSVFERLGGNSSSRNYEQDERPMKITCNKDGDEKKYREVREVSPSSHRHRGDEGNSSSRTAEQDRHREHSKRGESRYHSERDKESKLRSTIVVGNATRRTSEDPDVEIVMKESPSRSRHDKSSKHTSSDRKRAYEDRPDVGEKMWTSDGKRKREKSSHESDTQRDDYNEDHRSRHGHSKKKRRESREQEREEGRGTREVDYSQQGDRHGGRSKRRDDDYQPQQHYNREQENNSSKASRDRRSSPDAHDRKVRSQLSPVARKSDNRSRQDDRDRGADMSDYQRSDKKRSEDMYIPPVEVKDKKDSGRKLGRDDGKYADEQYGSAVNVKLSSESKSKLIVTKANIEEESKKKKRKREASISSSSSGSTSSSTSSESSSSSGSSSSDSEESSSDTSGGKDTRQKKEKANRKQRLSDVKRQPIIEKDFEEVRRKEIDLPANLEKRKDYAYDAKIVESSVIKERDLYERTVKVEERDVERERSSKDPFPRYVGKTERNYQSDRQEGAMDRSDPYQRDTVPSVAIELASDSSRARDDYSSRSGRDEPRMKVSHSEKQSLEPESIRRSRRDTLSPGYEHHSSHAVAPGSSMSHRGVSPSESIHSHRSARRADSVGRDVRSNRQEEARPSGWSERDYMSSGHTRGDREEYRGRDDYVREKEIVYESRSKYREEQPREWDAKGYELAERENVRDRRDYESTGDRDVMRRERSERDRTASYYPESRSDDRRTEASRADYESHRRVWEDSQPVSSDERRRPRDQVEYDSRTTSRKRHGETDISPPSGRRSYETHGGAEEEQYNRHYDYTRRETTRSEREPHDHRSRQEDWDQWAREKMVSKEGVQQRGAYDDRRRDDYAWKGREDEQRILDSRDLETRQRVDYRDDRSQRHQEESTDDLPDRRSSRRGYGSRREDERRGNTEYWREDQIERKVDLKEPVEYQSRTPPRSGAWMHPTDESFSPASSRLSAIDIGREPSRRHSDRVWDEKRREYYPRDSSSGRRERERDALLDFPHEGPPPTEFLPPPMEHMRIPPFPGEFDDKFMKELKEQARRNAMDDIRHRVLLPHVLDSDRVRSDSWSARREGDGARGRPEVSGDRSSYGNSGQHEPRLDRINDVERVRRDQSDNRSWGRSRNNSRDRDQRDENRRAKYKDSRRSHDKEELRTNRTEVEPTAVIPEKETVIVPEVPVVEENKLLATPGLPVESVDKTPAAAAVDNRNQTVEAPQPDYEPLSDDDNDLDMMLKGTDDGRENKETKMRIMDVLDIDWASLVQDNSSKNKHQKAKSALKYYSPANALLRLGISRKYTGDALFNELKVKCQRLLESEVESEELSREGDKDQSMEEDNTIASDKKTEDDNTIALKELSDVSQSIDAKTIGTSDNIDKRNKKSEENEMKDEIESKVKEEKEKARLEKPTFELLHDVAALHARAVRQKQEFKELVQSVGPFRRALCAQRDLAMRKAFCKIRKTLHDHEALSAVQVDQDMYRMSIQLFRGAGVRNLPLPVDTNISPSKSIPVASV